MERNGYRAVALVARIPALVPLSSRQEEDRFWYDAGDRGSRLDCDDPGLVYGFDCFACDADELDVTWSGVVLPSGH